jgi:hypothetical protein
VRITGLFLSGAATLLTILWRLRVLAAVLAIPPLLRLVSLDRLAARLGRPARVKRPSAEQQAAIAASVDRLLDRLPFPWRKTCLTRSTVLFHLLGRSGVPVELCIGVRRNGDAFSAHAWLTRDGISYLETEPPGYEVIATFGRKAPE